jgi:AcrR family transcriptional regulator
MARPRAPTFEHQRADILRAAATLFAARGYASASMASVAAACGMSKALLYHYYRDKQHILFDIADRYMEALLDIVAQVQARKLPPAEHLSELIDRFMRTYEHGQRQHTVLIQDVKFLGVAHRRRIIAKQRQVVDAFADVITSIRPRTANPALRVPLAMILFGMINWTFTWLRPHGKLSYSDMAGIVSEIFLSGLQAAPGEPPSRPVRRGAERALHNGNTRSTG